MNDVVREGNILMVEPEEILADVTQFRLELLGHHVRCVQTTEQALQELEKDCPEVLIVDWELPDASGQRLVEQLASDPATSDILILAVAVEADIESVQQAYGSGAADFLVAPYFPATLEEKVSRLLLQARERQRAKDAAAPLSPAVE